LGALEHAGGVEFTAFIDGFVLALDDTTKQPPSKINVGIGFNAPR
jgi:hypothetical protein